MFFYQSKQYLFNWKNCRKNSVTTRFYCNHWQLKQSINLYQRFIYKYPIRIFYFIVGSKKVIQKHFFWFIKVWRLFDKFSNRIFFYHLRHFILNLFIQNSRNLTMHYLSDERNPKVWLKNIYLATFALL